MEKHERTQGKPSTTDGSTIGSPIDEIPVPFLVRHSRRIRAVVIWSSFFGILYLMSSFLSLVFLTFILSYTLNSLVNWLSQRFSSPRWTTVLLVYLMVGVLAFGMGMIVVPKVYQEGRALYEDVPKVKTKFLDWLKSFREDPEYGGFLEGSGLEDSLKEYFAHGVQSFTVFVRQILKISFHLLLSLIFSFLILWDFDRLRKAVRNLGNTRVRWIFRILSPKLIQFGDILGKAFEAQILIALTNTLLTLLGLAYFGIPSKLFLSVIVFVCSFIPVVGVFISSLPICLLAYQSRGLFAVLEGLMLIATIHFIEAYLLNPRIVGAHLAVHPFVAVCILVISEYLAGIWGLLLGVPCAIFLYQSFILRPFRSSDPSVPLIPGRISPAIKI